jgi:hypothetical protein
MNSSIQNTTLTAPAETASEPLEAQVIQLWGDNPIAHASASEGAMTFSIGDGEVELARWVGGELHVTPPAGARVFVDRYMQTGEPFVLRAGHAADVSVGEHTFQISVGAREERPGRDLAAAVLEDRTVHTVAGSGIVHAALLAAVAFFMPAMSSADDGTIDRQRMLDLKAYVQSAAEREQDAKQQDTRGDDAPNGGTEGQRAKNEEGKMGGPTQTATHARLTLRGDQRPEDAKLARLRALTDAAHFGMIGLLPTDQADPNAPIATWGNVPVGWDRDNHLGDLFSGDPGDVFGNGLGLSGAGEGGGGTGAGIGLGNIGTLGTCVTSSCTGGPGGIGHGHGHLAPTHVAAGPHISWAGEVKSNGRLDPAVIQRIVRLNSGRFVGCYKDGLRTNPNLEGRVAVSFVIGRDGAVSLARDTSGSDLADTGVRSCVVRSFYGLSFPNPDGLVTVTYPFTFTPE